MSEQGAFVLVRMAWLTNTLQVLTWMRGEMEAGRGRAAEGATIQQAIAQLKALEQHASEVMVSSPLVYMRPEVEPQPGEVSH